jgi:hypothetical protein
MIEIVAVEIIRDGPLIVASYYKLLTNNLIVKND